MSTTTSTTATTGMITSGLKPNLLGSPEEILSSLLKVNMPQVSEEDFVRINKGRMAEVLDLVARSMQGRNEVAATRALIQQSRISSTRSRRPLADEDADPLYTRVRCAESQLKNAKISSTEAYSAQQKQRESVIDLEREESQMKAALEDRRLTAMFLSILEKKVKIRNERFAEISRLLEQLRSMESPSTSKEIGDVPIPPLKVIGKRPRTEYARDTLSAIQAHSLRLSRLSALAQENNLTMRLRQAEQRLLQAIARSMNLTPEDKEVISAFKKLQAAGRSQAHFRVQYRSPLPNERIMEDSQGISHRISEGENNLQGLADRSAALTLACAQSLQDVTNFARETCPALRDGLQQESRSSQGHVDTLRLSIVNRARLLPKKSQDGNLCEGRSFSDTLHKLERRALKVNDTESLFREVDAFTSADPKSADRDTTLLDTYMTEEAEFVERLRKLLERKARKTDAGDVLIEDIERLAAEVGIVSGGHV